MDLVRRDVPRTDALLADPLLLAAATRLGRPAVKTAVLAAQQRVRTGELAPAGVIDAVLAALPAAATQVRAVLNATGVVLHTNLGRAPLSTAAIDALRSASGYVDVEYDLDSGARARRGRGALDALLAAVPAADPADLDALLVNNGAAALVLAATSLAAGREIVVSRGELVEIGDGFRLPDLISSTGARLREVGTTNRTVLADYAAALGPDTGFVLKVHPSNFVITGFTAATPTAQLAGLGVPVIVDIGSGLLRPEPLLPDEPDAAGALDAGAVLVTASGDKLLGGPQAGLILGRVPYVARLRRHPLARALRPDKLTLAALEATLSGPEPPALCSLRADPAALRERAVRLGEALAADGVPVDVVPSEGVVGGGGAPGRILPGWAVALPAPWVRPLRLGRPPVIGRVERGRLLLDLRCVPPEQDAVLRAAVLAVARAAAVDAAAVDAAAGDPATGT